MSYSHRLIPGPLVGGSLVSHFRKHRNLAIDHSRFIIFNTFMIGAVTFITSGDIGYHFTNLL